LAVGAVADEGVEGCVADAEVGARRVVAGKARGVDALRSTAATLDLGPSTDGQTRRDLRSAGDLLLAPLRTVVGSARLEQPLARGPDGSGVGPGRSVLTPAPGQPE